MTKDEAEAWVAAYQRDRCECGGSPSWVDPYQQYHLVSCTAPNPLRVEPQDDGEPQTDGPLCDCGYPEGSFPCRIRHVAMLTGWARRDH